MSFLITPYSPKIQRLVTPLRLQRRRHLRSLKRRRLERQKEQKTEYEYVPFISPFLHYVLIGLAQDSPFEAHCREEGEGCTPQGCAQEVR